MIKIQYGDIDLDLRSYEFGNTRTQDRNTLITDHLIVKTDNIDPYRRFEFNIAGLAEAQSNEFLRLVEKSQGFLVTVIDYIYGEVYVGVIESPEVSRGPVGECHDTVSFILNVVGG